MFILKVYFSILLPPCSENKTTGVVIYINVVGMHTLPMIQTLSFL